MKKLVLSVEELRVDSFHTCENQGGHGTVRAHLDSEWDCLTREADTMYLCWTRDPMDCPANEPTNDWSCYCYGSGNFTCACTGVTCDGC